MAYQVTTTKKPLQPAQPTIAPVNPLVKQQVAETPPRSTPASANVGPAQQPAGPTSTDLTPVTTAPAKTPQQRLDEEIASGYANADKYGIGKAGSMGEIKDERKAEIDDLLAKQKAGLDGMTPEEMLAAKEQGNATINGQLATNMQQFADVAAGNGIRGGSAAGLQMQAMAGAQAESGQLARKMILDNVAQKNIAMDRYGKTLGEQQGVGIGIQDKNNQTRNAETLARELAAAGYTSLLDSYKSGDKADALSNRGIGILEDQVKNLGRDAADASGTKPSGSGAGPKGQGKSGTPMTEQAAAQAIADKPHLFTKSDGSLMTPEEALKSGGGYEIYLTSTGKKPGPKSKYEYLTEVAGLSPEDAREKAGINEPIQPKDPTDTSNKIICTEAFHQGLISEEQWLVTQRYRMLLTMREYKGYLTWATPVVARMRRSPAFAKTIAPYIRRMIEGERYALGEISSLTLGERTVATLVKIANYSAYAFRVLRLKAQSAFAVRAAA